ncbi:MAG: enoyl-CoA hydratase/isomerase family protein [Dehalococcoidia bacterium]
MGMGDEAVLYEKRGHVATMTLNRPERMNAFNADVHRRVPEIWEEVKRDDGVWVVIVTGTGERAFTTGMDVKDAAVTGGPAARGGSDNVHERMRLTAVQAGVWKPVIAAVNGICAGGGLHFVADSDIAIAAEHATFVDTHVSVGQVAALEPIVLARRMPLGTVLRMALIGRGERLTAQQALQAGLVSQVVPAAELMPEANRIADLLCENSLAAMMKTKQAIWESLDMGLHDGLQHGWELLRSHWQHPDYREGPLAFAERRKPEWGGPHSPMNG